MPIRNIPDTVYEVIKNIDFNSMERTKRSKGIYYYRDKVYNNRKVVINISHHTITFKRELPNATRLDELIYNYSSETLQKNFWQWSYKAKIQSSSTYGFYLNEEQHFMQSTVEDKFFPTHHDYVMIDELKTIFLKDVAEWITSSSENNKKRKQERMDAWDKVKANWKSKVKRTSS